MESTTILPESILAILPNDEDLKAIAKKVVEGKRISNEEGLLLFEKGELNFVGALANYIRTKLHGQKTYFNRNFHIEPTNVCLFTCAFCSYSRTYKKQRKRLGIKC